MLNPSINSNTRRSDRISLPLPILVESKNSSENSWSESTRLKTVTTFGAGFEVQNKVSVGQVLHLTTAFPTKLRCYDYFESQYNVWALVRHCNLRMEQNLAKPYSVGVAFLGKSPPSGYFQNPTQLYSINQFCKNGLCVAGEAQLNSPLTYPQKFSPQKHPRYDIPFEVFIETLDEKRNPLDREYTVTDNVSLGGASVKTLLTTRVGGYVRVSCLGKNVSLLAAVRNYRMGADGVPRLHLEFIDRQFPLEGIG